MITSSTPLPPPPGSPRPAPLRQPDANSGSGYNSGRTRDRSHSGPPRRERIRLRLTGEELATVAAAAHEAGLSVSGYAAEAVVATVLEAAPPLPEPLRAALADLVDVRAQLRRLGANVHLAVGAIHRLGAPPPWLRAAVQDAAAAVRRVDEAAAAVTAALPRGPR